MPFGVASAAGLLAQRCGWWRQEATIRPQSFFVNRDEEEKAFVYGRAKIGVGFSRVFGPWERDLRAMLPGYEADAAGNFVQTKTSWSQRTRRKAMLEKNCAWTKYGLERSTFEKRLMASS